MVSRMIGMDREQCIEALQSYEDEIEALMRLVDAGGDPADAQAQMRVLKASMEHDVKIRGTAAGREQMTAPEEACFEPAVRNASIQLAPVLWNGKPDGEWFQRLYAAQVDIGWGIGQLQG